MTHYKSTIFNIAVFFLTLKLLTRGIAENVVNTEINGKDLINNQVKFSLMKLIILKPDINKIYHLM